MKTPRGFDHVPVRYGRDIPWKAREVLLITTILAVTVVSGCTQSSKERDASADSGQKAAAGPGQKTTAASARSRPKAQTACEVLTAGETAGALNVPAVKKDEINSGKNEMTTVDLCNWYAKEGSSEGIELKLRRAESSDEGDLMMLFRAVKGDATEHDVERDRKAQQLAGVGDEAVYSVYAVGDGGSIVLRVGRSVLTITGSASKDALMSLAKLAEQRL